jgi:ubiquinone/menaquinone biosynthesis C-methylase UbiE
MGTNGATIGSNTVIMNYEDNPNSIKFYVKRFIVHNKEKIKGKKIIDFPAGNGVTSRIIKEVGGKPYPFDLFPEYFNVEGIDCKRASVSKGLPISENVADMIICQEGIEHFSDQLQAFKEFSRVLKKGGTLLVTTPNYSNLRSKLSYLISESERFGSYMPPNELDSIWMSDQEDEIYFGHIFLIGIQKLRLFARLSGFKIKKIYATKTKSTSVLLFPLFYPFIYFFNWMTYQKNLRKNKLYSKEIKKSVYKEVFRLSIDPKILTGSHLMIEFEKQQEASDVTKELKSQHNDFGLT